MLEENIARLEARIRELESPDDDNAVKLHNPYVETLQQERRTTSMPVLAPVEDDIWSSFVSVPATSAPGKVPIHSRLKFCV